MGYMAKCEVNGCALMIATIMLHDRMFVALCATMLSQKLIRITGKEVWQETSVYRGFNPNRNLMIDFGLISPIVIDF